MKVMKAWLARRKRERLASLLGGHYAMALASGDLRRAEGIKVIIDQLKEGQSDGAMDT